MDIRAWARLVVVPLVGGAGLVVPTTPVAVAAPAPAATTAIRDLYVSNTDCAPGGSGTVDAPFCTISAAAAVAEPGQTVLVQPGSYPEAVTVTRSGEVGAPITFRAVNGPDGGSVAVGETTTGAITGPAFTLTGVHDVRVEGFRLNGVADQSTLVVDGSQRVTVDAVTVQAGRAANGAVRVTGRSGGVTVSRSFLSSGTGYPSLAIDAEVVGAVVTGNQFSNTGLRVTDAPGTVVTNNTVRTNCVIGIEVTGVSTGVSIQNNIVATSRFRQLCTAPTNITAISVSAGSVPGTIADHNLIDPASGGTLYTWGDAPYRDLAEFRKATGQGGHDLATDPMIGTYVMVLYRPWYQIDPASPAVDSGDASARGVTGTDMLGNPRTDNPAVDNTGTGAGYHDRGAVEAQGDAAMQADVRRKPGGNPFAVTASAVPQYTWPVGSEAATIAYQFEGERFWRVTDARSVDHVLRRAGRACAKIRISRTGFRGAPELSAYRCTVVGALYEAVYPTRLLDTRASVGTPTTTPVGPKSEVVLDIPSINAAQAADISAVVLNVTVTRPTTAGFLTVYPDGGLPPVTSNVNFVANETVPNLVTVPMTNGKVRFRNNGNGTVHVIADLQGFYGSYGAAMRPIAPTRALDTRTGAGTPVGAYGTLRLDLSGTVPVEAKAAILNVTVTAPKANGVLTLFPDGWPVPTASNLNFVTGQTVPNLVVVPLVAGKAMIRNASPGTTHVVVDVAGYYAAPSYGVADQTYVPYGPYRTADSRDSTGWVRPASGPFAPREKAAVAPWWEDDFCGSDCPQPTAAVVNLTVTAPTAGGVLTAYPSGTTPPTASNVNFVAQETASNLAVVKVGADGRIAAYHNSSGSAHVIVDQSGYFIAAP